MTFSIDNPEGGCNNPPLGKYVSEKPSGEQGLNLLSRVTWGHFSKNVIFVPKKNFIGVLYNLVDF